MDRAAAMVRGGYIEEPRTAPSDELIGAAGKWSQEAELLLDRQRQLKTVQDVHLPSHISASLFVDLGADPAAVLTQLRRPVPPREPGISARKGTAFHAWVEEYFGTTGMLDLDEAPGSDSHIDEPTAWMTWWRRSNSPSGPSALRLSSKCLWKRVSATS